MDEDADAVILAALWRRSRLLPPIDSATPAAARLRQWGLLLTLACFIDVFLIPFILAFHVGSTSFFLSARAA